MTGCEHFKKLKTPVKWLIYAVLNMHEHIFDFL